MQVGSIVKLKINCLGNTVGTVGFVYEEYDIGYGHCVSVVFENGNYDGFLEDEQEEFLEEIGLSAELANYQFTDVMKLSKDFDDGMFDSVFTCK